MKCVCPQLMCITQQEVPNQPQSSKPLDKSDVATKHALQQASNKESMPCTIQAKNLSSLSKDTTTYTTQLHTCPLTMGDFEECEKEESENVL